ncbi:uncharacterized protein LOC102801933 [Saccoglossus kowalevskii]|uniref:POU domain, class 2, transcription factor 1-like n=1 Tax=Saccoglossus kowalevskii TaxID=10224 RepID=A0ABM0N143_SACKO|nr:PREDICTED: POU domain, class 2, transcription factor 1-like [Saccoglossus kowalevskii]
MADSASKEIDEKTGVNLTTETVRMNSFSTTLKIEDARSLNGQAMQHSNVNGLDFTTKGQHTTEATENTDTTHQELQQQQQTVQQQQQELSQQSVTPIALTAHSTPQQVLIQALPTSATSQITTTPTLTLTAKDEELSVAQQQQLQAQLGQGQIQVHVPVSQADGNQQEVQQQQPIQLSIAGGQFPQQVFLSQQQQYADLNKVWQQHSNQLSTQLHNIGPQAPQATPQLQQPQPKVQVNAGGQQIPISGAQLQQISVQDLQQLQQLQQQNPNLQQYVLFQPGQMAANVQPQFFVPQQTQQVQQGLIQQTQPGMMQQLQGQQNLVQGQTAVNLTQQPVSVGSPIPQPVIPTVTAQQQLQLQQAQKPPSQSGEEPTDLEELEQFAKMFKQRRIKLGFTQRCLARLVEKTGQPSHCPLCKREHEVQVSDLSINAVIKEISQAFYDEETLSLKLKLMECAACEKGEITKRCVDCAMNICDICANAH